MVDPSTVWLAHDTAIGQDVTIEPNVFFGPGVTIDDDVIIHANCHLLGVRVRQEPALAPSRGCVPAPTSAPMSTSAILSRSRT